MEETIAKIIGTLFMSRTYSHMAHLKTSSFAKHKALNEFYDSIVDLADELAEAAQGQYGKLDIPFVDMKGDVENPVEGISTHLVVINNLYKKCDEEYLCNILQEIQKLYRQTIYKLKELD